MPNSFYSWQYFKSNFSFIIQNQIDIIQDISNKFDLSVYKQYISKYEIQSNHSYLTSSDIPDFSGLIFTEYQENKFIKYNYAVNNIFSYIPDNKLSLEDIKGFNLMDYIIVPTLEVKKYIESKIPKTQNLKFIPFEIEANLNINNNKIALCIDPNDLKNLGNNNSNLKTYLKSHKYDIYNNENRVKLYENIGLYNLIIDFHDDFLSSIIQKKALINKILYISYSSNNIFSDIKQIIKNDIEEKIDISKKNILLYSDILKNTYSGKNSESLLTDFIKELKDNENQRNFYINNFRSESLSYHSKLDKLLSQIKDKYDFIISDQEDIKEIELKKEQVLANNQKGLIIIQQSEFYPNQTFIKDNFLILLEPLKLVREIYTGSKELKFDNKELIIMIFIKPEYNYENINNKIFVVWEGYQFFHISLAVINRELESNMIDSNNYEVSIMTHDYYQEISEEYINYNKLKYCVDKPLAKRADFHIRHVYPTGLFSPQEGKYILIFPWEDGKIPQELISHINLKVDELWCPSEYIKQLHINSGVIKRKIHVIPNGIDLTIFKPKKERYLLNTSKTFKFLFVGGLLFRKGLDILLQAYINEFNINDDVCLVIKGLGKDTYYNSDKISELLDYKDKFNPEIILIDENMDSENLSSLYNSCNVYVHPYRAEGFGMPIFEAMACGLIPITTKYGPSLEYCNNLNSFLIDYDYKENLEMYTFIEPDIKDLQKKMRYVYDNQHLLKNMSREAVKSVQCLSWENIYNKVDSRLKRLKNLPEYRNNREYYINLLKEKISKDHNNSDILDELEYLCDRFEYNTNLIL